ncbi:MAG: pilus assembly protein, partial [Actinobacteria bacterium]
MRIRQRLDREDGAAAVEFALIIGVLAMLIFGMLQFGLTFFELQNLRAAAREGGRLGAVGATPDAIRADLESASNGAIRSGEAGNLAFVKVSYSDTGTFTGSEPNLSG